VKEKLEVLYQSRLSMDPLCSVRSSPDPCSSLISVSDDHMCVSSLLKKKNSTRLGQFCESTG